MGRYGQRSADRQRTESGLSRQPDQASDAGSAVQRCQEKHGIFLNPSSPVKKTAAHLVELL